MKYKTLLTKGIGVIGLSCLSTIAFAIEFNIDNQTNEPSTMRMYGRCTSDLLRGGVGVTPAHTRKPFSEPKIRIACVGHHDDCAADVFMSDNCSGPVVASGHFGIKSGILGFSETEGHNYSVNAPNGSYEVTIKYKS